MKKTASRKIRATRKAMGSLRFVDLFAGCGGLSLGLLSSGWNGLFAIEQNSDAFKTLRHNLIDEGNHNKGRPLFNWPRWLDVGSHEIRRFINDHRGNLQQLRGDVHLVAGGPPCQGFSFAGKRNGKDPRNELFRLHLEIVDIVKPKIVLLENVRGIDTAFGAKEAKKRKRRGRPRKSYAKRIKDALASHSYEVQQKLLRAADFGVPQYRPRYFTVGIREGIFRAGEVPDFFEMLRGRRANFLEGRGLSVDSPVTVSEAISDLKTVGKAIVPCEDPESPAGFTQIVYEGPASHYQRLMRKGMNGQPPNSLRLVNHRPETTTRFRKILSTCRKGVQLSNEDRERLGIKKSALAPLAPHQPSHTLTTLPDDLLHYAEPRIHTVREHARLQSFPDWVEFQGKYTTGGDRRTRECPRYTQVGNAVPPLLAEAIGEVLADLLECAHSTHEGRTCSRAQARSDG